MPAKILLVDDDPVSLRMMSKALEATYEVRTATDGARGLSEAIEFRPDLIISDQAMPHMDGAEFCRRVKADPSLSSALFVLLSAVNTPEARVRGASNADDFLVKPLPFDQLRARVDQFLKKKAPGAAEKPGGPARAPAQIAHVLMELTELARPGAANRALQMAAASEWMAEKLEMPPEQRPNLDFAACLESIGRMGLEPKLARANPRKLSPADWEAYRLYSALSYRLLRQIDSLQPAAGLIRYQFENWDGSGFPEHLLQIRIPLGSRILRVLVDFFQDLERVSDAESRAALLGELRTRAGSVYDPAVFQALEEYVHQQLDASLATERRYVALEDLEAGMKLASDLVAASGAKLITGGEVLTEDVIERIRRHHGNDPIVGSIPVFPAQNP